VVALKLQNFGGQIPAVDNRLLPQDSAALAQNAWVYTGALEGMRQHKLIYTPTNPDAKKIYRIPKQYYDKDHIQDSYWLEFLERDTDVIHSPAVDDSYERYYWAASQKYYPTAPQYNTKTRIAAGQAPFTLGIPAPTYAPVISKKLQSYTMDAATAAYYLAGRAAALYHQTNFEVDPETLANGLPDVTSKAIAYSVDGFSAQMRRKTTVGTHRVVIDDHGNVTDAIPTTPVAAITTSQPTPLLGSWAYVYTWVSAYGEESPPSPAVTFDGNIDETRYVRVTAPNSSVTTNRNITTVRIYRTVTGATGAASYFFLADMDISKTSYTDDTSDVDIVNNNILESLYWDPPPSDLEGMIAMPNGILAGFRKNEIWFCEPYRPHAWPSPYTLATEYPIVGLGVTGQTLIVATTGYPYAVTGTHPTNMNMTRVATYEPCMSRGSIVSGVDGVYYASPNGVVRAYGYVVEVISKALITKDHWLDYLYVQSLRAARVNGAYYTWGSVLPGCFEATGFEGTAFLEDDYTGARSGALIEFTNQRVAYNTLYTDDPILNVTTDHWTGEVFILRKGKYYWFDLSSSNPHAPYKWRSKVFEMPNKRNLEAMRVYFGTPDGNYLPDEVNDADDDYSINMQYDTGDLAIVRVYADDRLVFARQLEVSGDLFRLPSGFKAIYWQIEIEGIVPIYSVEIATAAKELKSV
jgi:hypothetical protein